MCIAIENNVKCEVCSVLRKWQSSMEAIIVWTKGNERRICMQLIYTPEKNFLVKLNKKLIPWGFQS